jgi:hypothetical protein
MGKKIENSTAAELTRVAKAIRRITTFPVFLLKVVYVIPFLIFGLWLLHTIYFPEFEIDESAALPNFNEEEDIFEVIMNKKEAVPRGHFHMIDEYISVRESNPPLCVVCHGTYPHSKEKKVRAILNFHTGFIACAVCHARQDSDEDVLSTKDYILRFLWVDRQTGDINEKVEGEYGKYPAKIFPIRFTEDGPKRVFRPVGTKAAQQFLKLKDKFTPDQTAQAKIKLHERISEKPVFCSDCHKKDGYLDYAELGFPKRRVDHLVSTEVVGMIDKYKTFYLPSVIDFSSETPLE